LIDEQREIDEGVPNTGRDRLLMRLQEVHVYPRYDFPPELSRHIDIHGFIRSMIKR
jgi:hypothetical protein